MFKVFFLIFSAISSTRKSLCSQSSIKRDRSTLLLSVSARSFTVEFDQIDFPASLVVECRWWHSGNSRHSDRRAGANYSVHWKCETLQTAVAAARAHLNLTISTPWLNWATQQRQRIRNGDTDFKGRISKGGILASSYRHQRMTFDVSLIVIHEDWCELWSWI
jgi:hypothetical protein